MKPHEETWTTEGHCDEVRTLPDRAARLQSTTLTEGDTSADDVARLAAQAPAMARLLLEIEWSGQNQWGQRQCPLCHGDEWEEGEPRTGHEEGCQLLIVLHDAGVRS